MSKLPEIFAFSGLAVGAHLALWVWVGGSGSESAGEGGESVVSLAAASGNVSEMVDAWTAPPEVLDMTPNVPSSDTTIENSPSLTPVLARPEMPAQPSAPDMAQADAAPTQPTQPPAPPTPDVVAQPVQPDTPQDLALMTPDTAPALPRSATPAAPPLPQGQDTPRIDTETAPPQAPAPRTSVRPVERPADLIKPTRQATSQPKSEEKAKPTTQTKASKQASNPSVSTTAQKAKGNSAGQNAGTTAKAATATLSKATRQKLISTWGGAIRSGVERRKRYPNGTSASGTAVVRLTVAPQGRLVAAKLAKSSGDAKLDRAAIDAVRRARIPKAPKGLSKASYSFSLPIAFTKK